MAASLSPLARGASRTVGPGCCGADEGRSGGGGGGGAGVWVVADASGERAGYFRAAEPAALAALEDAEPMLKKLLVYSSMGNALVRGQVTKVAREL